MRGLQPVRILPAAALFAIVITATPAAEAREYKYTIIADTSGPYSELSSATINDSGTVAFWARLDSGGEVIGKGEGGPVTTLLTLDGPGGPYSTFHIGEAHAMCIINNTGAVAFFAGLKTGGAAVQVLEAGEVRVVADRTFFGRLGIAYLVDFNNAGQVSFLADKDFGTGTRTTGGYIDGTPVLEFDAADPPYSLLHGPVLNDFGIHAYSALTRNPLGTQGEFQLFRNGIKILAGSDTEYQGFQYPVINNSRVIFSSAAMDDQSRRVIRMDAAPEPIAQTGAVYTAFGPIVAANDAGDVVFKAGVSGAPGGLFTGPDPVEDKVIRLGDAVGGSKITSIPRDRLRLNEHGQVAFVATLADGRWAVVRADPVVESDIDGDGLLDDWEKKGGGIDADGDGVIDVSLWELGADPEHMDLFLELDFIQGQSITQAAADSLVKAFKEAPLFNPDAEWGIRLHLDMTETNLTSPAVAPITSGWPTNYYDLKKAHFGTPEDRADPNAANILAARRKFVRYGIGYDRIEGGGIAGRGEVGGNDLFLCLGVGYLNDGYEDDNHQASLVMHELGHNLNLGHGGLDTINGKPNYVSVMNYIWVDISVWNHSFWNLDYSYRDLGSLVENDLDEPKGVPSDEFYNSTSMPFGVDSTCDGAPCRIREFVLLDGSPTDWSNANGATETGVTQDLTYMGPSAPFSEFRDPSPGQTLRGHNDWENIIFAINEEGDHADRPSGELPEDEPSQEMHDWIRANIPIPPTPCPDLPDRYRIVRVDRGQAAEFTVTVRGDGPFTYRWRKDGQPLSDGGNVSGAETATLTLASVQPSDAGRYSLSVTAACGTRTSNVTKLEVAIPYTVDEAVQALRIASGLLSATSAQMERLDVYRVKPSRDVIELVDATRILGRALRR